MCSALLCAVTRVRAPSSFLLLQSLARTLESWPTPASSITLYPQHSLYRCSSPFFLYRNILGACCSERRFTMFSGSSSYLGGANSGRPGQQQYGQQPPYQQQPSPFGAQQTGFGMPQMQLQFTGMPPSGGLQPQATGFPGQGGLQPQATGFPGQQQQQFNAPQQMPQYTGFPAQNNQQFQQQPPQQQQQQQQQGGFQQPQQTGFQQPQQTGLAPPRQRPQPTGMTSSQMADSFRSSPAPAPTTSSAPKASNKIPNIRLSFITAQDQAKFEQLFKSAVGNDQALSGDKAKDLLLRSKLPGDALSQIW